MMNPASLSSRLVPALAASLLLSGCGVVARSIVRETTGYVSPGPTDEARAKAAWAYFRSVRGGNTGLSEAIAGAGFATPASIGDQIAAAIAADRLRIITPREFDDTISQTLAFLGTMRLSNGEMPARFYSTNDGRPMDPPNQGADPGWSGVDAGRLLVWLRILAQRYPTYEPFVVKAVGRWQTCRAIDDHGILRKALPSPNGFVNQPDAGTGYAAYAAQGFRAWGENASGFNAEPSDTSISVESVNLPLTGSEPFHSVPYVLLNMEFGGAQDQDRRVEAQLWDAQEARWRRTGMPTARADFHLTRPPYAINDAVLASGYPWNTTDGAGKAHPELSLISTKAAFGLATLHGGPFARRLMDSVGTLYDPGGGWYEGRYEASGAFEWTRTSATNALVLEALLYRQTGALFGHRTALNIPDEVRGSCHLPDITRSEP